MAVANFRRGPLQVEQTPTVSGNRTETRLPSALLNAARLVTFVLICALLYWGQVVLIPLALAGLVTFLLNPIVTRCRRFGLPRGVAVFLVITLVTGLLAALGWVMTSQVRGLADDLPAYRENIREKVADVRALMRGGTIEQVRATIDDLSKDIEEDAEAEKRAQGTEPEPEDDPEPVPVEIRSSSIFDEQGMLASLLEPVGRVGLALLLSIFMLIKQTDIRNRLVSLGGVTSLVTTTHALSEAGQRISRYLLMQFIINATMGVAVWIGLYLIGVPYSAIWGLTAGVLRYIPYVGPWAAALLPLTVSLITAPGWSQVAMVAGLFVTLELLSNNVMEPLLYGNSSGLSAVAVIVAAVFWTWMWGPIGLILATPLTACIVVLSRYVPGLAMFDRLLSDRPALDPHVALYQRLLAKDEHGARETVEEFAATHSTRETCEDLILGAVLALKRDAAEDRLTLDEVDSVADGLLQCIEDIEQSIEPPEDRDDSIVLTGFPSDDYLDEIPLRLLRVLLRETSGSEMEVLSADTLIGERIARIKEQERTIVCIPSLPPADLSRTRNTCKRIATQVPDTKILVVRFSEATQSDAELRSHGAQQVTQSLGGVLEIVAKLARNGQAPPTGETLGKAGTPNGKPGRRNSGPQPVSN